MGVIRWINRRRFFFPLLSGFLAVGILFGPRWTVWPLWLILKIAVIGLLAKLCRKLRFRLIFREIHLAKAEMRQGCDPEPLLRASQEIAEAYLRGYGRRYRIVDLQLSAADAAGRLGRIQEAEAHLNSILEGYERFSADMQFAVDLMAGTVRIWAGRLEDARSFLREAERKLDRMDPGGKNVCLLRNGLDNRLRLYQLKREGGSEKLLLQFQRETEEAEESSLMDQVCTRMNMARCLLNLGRADEARPHLEFVAERGGKLAIRTEAVALLAEMDPQA